LGYLSDEPHRAALVAFQQTGYLFPEGLPPAALGRAGQSSYAQVDDDLVAVDRHVLHCPVVIPVHLRRRSPAHRTQHGYVPSAGRDHHHAVAVRHVLDEQRRQPGKHRPYKGFDIHHKIMIANGYLTSPPTTGQSRTFTVPVFIHRS
jgi:hypothetical protein